MPRIVSLIASATEIVCSLGFEADLVGRSHECDYPPSVKRLPVCTAPKFAVAGTSAEIDQRVKDIVKQGLSVYHVDEELLRELEPDVIVTQSHCEVCAVSLRDVERAVCAWLRACPQLVSLSPNNLADVWAGIEHVAEVLGVPERGAEVVGGLRSRIATIGARAAALPDRPTVACIEWVEPLMAAGNWVPELVALAGGDNLFGEAGKHAPWMSWEQLVQRNPDVIVLMPCGYDLARTREDLPLLADRPGWAELNAVRSGRVFVTDGNQYFNRPGPRLVESLEILAASFIRERFTLDTKAWGGSDEERRCLPLDAAVQGSPGRHHAGEGRCDRQRGQHFAPGRGRRRWGDPSRRRAELLTECRNLGGCPTGEARITHGHNLPAKYVIHTVGPVWNGGTFGEDELLARCYRACFALVDEYQIRSVSFPAISCGVYGYPLDRAGTIAVKEMRDFLEHNEEVERVHVVCYTSEVYEVYRTVLQDLVPE